MSKNASVSDWVTYGRLLRYVVSYWHFFFISILGFILFSAAQIAIADLMQFIVDSLGDNVISDGGIVASLIFDIAGANVADKDARNWVAIGIIIIGLARGIGFFIGNYYIVYVSRYLVHNLRCHIFDHLLVVPSQQYDQHASGFLLSRIIYTVDQVTDAGTKALKVLVREGIFAIGLIVYLFYANWGLTLFFLFTLPVMAVIVLWVGKRFRKISEKIQDSMGEVTQAASESIAAYKEVRTFGGSEDETARFYKASEKNRKQGMKMAFYNAMSPPVIQQPITIVLAFLVWVGLGLSGEMTAGEFVAYLTVALLLPKPIRQLSEVYSIIQKGLAAAHDIFSFLDSPAEKDHGTEEKRSVNGRITFNNVSFQYSEEAGPVLKNINLTIEPGQSVALVGSSGSGKSTLVSLLTRFYDHTDGQVLIDDIDVMDFRLENLRSHIALVTQSVTLFNDTVKNNIAYGCMRDASDDDIMAAAVAAHADEFVHKLPLGFSTITGDDGVMLSGGQRQRLAIARALLKDAPILILDEATSALDNQSERHIQDALETVMEGRTSIIIAHRLSTIENADVILVLEDGEIVERGNHTELMAFEGRYRELHNNQFDD